MSQPAMDKNLCAYWQAQHQAALQRVSNYLGEYPVAQASILSLMARAYDRALQLGLPHRRLDNWRYAARALQQAIGTIADDSATQSVSSADNYFCAARYVSVPSGASSDKVSWMDAEAIDLPAGVQVGSLASALQNPAAAPALITHWQQALERLLEQPVHDYQQHTLALLAAASWVDSCVIYVPAAVHLDELLHVQLNMLQPTLAASLCFIILEQQAKAHILLEHRAPKPDSALQVMWCDIACAAESTLVHYQLQAADSSLQCALWSQVQIAAQASYDLFSAGAGARLWRQENIICLSAPKAHASTTHLLQSNADRQFMETRCQIHHQAPECQSQQVWRASVKHASQMVQQGAVKIAPGASTEQATQDTAAVLLHGAGEVVTQPALEIYHDAVQCVHGATIGELDPAALFYLQSRGLTRTQALQLLQTAFAQQAWQHWPHPSVAAYMQQRLQHSADDLSDQAPFSSLLQARPLKAQDVNHA